MPHCSPHPLCLPAPLALPIPAENGAVLLFAREIQHRTILDGSSDEALPVIGVGIH